MALDDGRPVRISRCDGRVVAIQVDELVVGIFLVVLVLLGLITGTSTFEPLARCPLTFAAVAGLGVVALVFALRRQFGGIASVVVDWWPVLAALATYESLRALHENRLTTLFGILPRDAAMIRLDELSFGRVLPLRLQSPSSDALLRTLDLVQRGVYTLGPFVALGVASFILRDRDLFARLRRGLVFALLGGFCLHVLIPVAGPLFYVGNQFTRPIFTHPGPGNVAFEVYKNQWDRFPSLETALPWMFAVLSFHRLNFTWRAVVAALCLGSSLSTLLLRVDYGVSVLSGVLWAGLVSVLVTRSEALRKPVRAVLRLPRRALFRGLSGRVVALTLVFVLTGMAALLAEQSFEKLLSTLLGSSTEAAAIVLATYFAGLTLGAFGYGTIASRRGNPFRDFACLEAGVAVWAFFLACFHESIARTLLPLLVSGASSRVGLGLARALVASIWILPPTLLMGASFPAVVRVLEVLRYPDAKRVMSVLYTANLLGAFIGALLGPYLLFPGFGVDGVLVIAALMDGTAFAFALFLSRMPRKRSKTRPPPVRQAERRPTVFRYSDFVLVVVAAASGFVFFSLEVLWTHLISAVLGNSVYSFAVVLGLVLASLLIGSAVASTAFPGKRSIPAAALSGAFILGAAFLCVETMQWPSVPHWFSRARPWVSTFGQAEVFRWTAAAVLLVPTASVLGFVYPALFRLEDFPEARKSQFVSWVAAANAVGCLTGASVTGFVLIPRLGSERSLGLFSFICALSGALLSFRVPGVRARLPLWVTAALAAVIPASLPAWDRLALTSGEHVYFARGQVWPESKLVFFQEDTISGMTTVVDNPAGINAQPQPFRTLLTNGKFQGNDAWEKNVQLGVALIPMLYLRDFRRACVIGLGTGQTASVPPALGFSDVEVAELAPGIVDAARYFDGINRGVLKRPDVHLWMEDGRNFFLLHPTLTCDLISVQIASVWFAGSTNLYSREFYELTKSRLGHRGILQQWIQLHHIGMEELGTVLATMREVYPYVSVWAFRRQGILVASEEPLVLSPEAVRRFFLAAGELGLGPSDAAGQFLTELLSSRLLSPPEVSAFKVRYDPVINTDVNRNLEYSTVKYNVRTDDFILQNLRAFAKETQFPKHEVVGDWPPEHRIWVEKADPRRALGRD